MKIKLPSWPLFSKEESDAVSKVLLSNKVNYWTGEQCRLFEKEFAEYSSSKYAVAVSNGTVALDLALKALDIKSGDEVIVTSRTFIASVSSIVNAGAIPVFADIDRDSQNITPQSISAVLSDKTKAIVAVHLAGWPCEMDGIMELATKHNLFVIEDCAQAHGARYKNTPVGSIGHIGAWSFCQDKIMTTGGEGGMVTTNDRSLWNTMWSYKDHGKSYSAVYEQDHPPGFRWLHHSFGTNWRMTEMQAAIGRIQIQNMPQWTKTRNHYSEIFEEVCKKFDSLRLPQIPNNITHARYKFYVFVEPEKLKENWTRDKIIEEFNGVGVPCFQGSCSEVYLEKAFDGTNFRPVRPLKVAKELGETSLMFLVHPSQTEKNIEEVASIMNSVFKAASVI